MQVSSDVNSIRLHIYKQLAAAVAERCGYTWTDERVERVALDTCQSIEEGIPDRWAFTSAFDIELKMYGDGSVNNLVGIV